MAGSNIPPNSLRPHNLPWVAGSVLIALLSAIPIYFILKEVSAPALDGWKAISTPLEIDGEPIEPSAVSNYIKGSLIMVGGVAVLTLIIGIGAAWLVSAWDFPGRRLLSLALVFPITIPTYVTVVMYDQVLFDTYTAFLNGVREKHGHAAKFEAANYWKHTMAVLILSACYYPYVYLAARASFSRQSAIYLEGSRMLGRSTAATFFRVALPLARPAIVAGLSLALLETLNEFGAMKILGIETLTTGIFYVWNDLEELNSAIRIAAILMAIVLVLVALELALRGRRKFHGHSNAAINYSGRQLGAGGTIIAWLICLSIIGAAFLVPAWKVVQQAMLTIGEKDLSPYLELVLSSSWLALRAALAIIAGALVLSYTCRIVPGHLTSTITRLSLLGYALPGAILGVVLLSAKGVLQTTPLTSAFAAQFFYTSAYGLILAYFIRFLILGFNPIEAGFKQIPLSLDEASRTLGRGRFTTLVRIHLPALRLSILAGFIVLFVDLLKELPLTLILLPSNPETLATKTYGLFRAEERIAEGCIPALILITTGIAGVILISFLVGRQAKH